MNKDYIKVCKRVNNNKRNFLVLNTAQCKHVPSSPSKAFEMFDELASKVADRYANEKIMLVGFAETATAIGSRISEITGYDYIHTTREFIPDDNYYNFSETHSHATNQKLYKYDFSDYDRIVFIEDEVTTGNTILNIIDVISNDYRTMQFGVASLLNGMTEKHLQKFDILEIPVDYLIHIDNSNYSSIADSIDLSSNVSVIKEGIDYKKNTQRFGVRYLNNERFGVVSKQRLHNTNTLKSIAEVFVNECKDKEDVLILGTEEFMYPAIYVGKYFEENSSANVYCHSTTRSPIGVSNTEGYPLTNACKMPSVYDEHRETYLYNLRKYDKVFIIAESIANNFDYIVEALKNSGNTDIRLIKVGA